MTFAATPFPVSIENGGTFTTYTHSPKRAFTMNQAATQIMLALGLHDRMVGTAFLDDAILEEYADAYAAIPVRTTGYPSRDELIDAKPDFVYAAFESAFLSGEVQVGVLFRQMRDGGVHGERGSLLSTLTALCVHAKTSSSPCRAKTREAAGAAAFDAGCHGQSARPGP